MKRFNISSFSEMAEGMRRSYHKKYLAMYSSVYGGIVTDPVLMMVPVDDHMVHRGDGIFEAFECINGRIYNMKAHMDRLECSASMLYHKLPGSLEDISRTVIETVRAGGRKNCSIRLFVSRGPGSFDANPYDCPDSQLYVVITSLEKSFMDHHSEGARVRTSNIPVKPRFFARVKSCNYLPNVLMKKEALDLGVDFVVTFDENGFLLESATANMGVRTKEKALLFPKLDGVLRGTTMMRVVELAEKLVESGDLAETGFTDISRDAILNAVELLITGTTVNITAVREFDGRPVGNGRPGPVYEKLSALLLDDMLHNSNLQTPVFDS